MSTNIDVESAPQGTGANTISLLLGHPDPSTLMKPDLQTTIQQLLSQPQGLKALQYGSEQGAPTLIRFLVEKINREQGLAIGAANIMIVGGSTHAVDMIARLYANEGDVVLVEAPSYTDSLHIFRDHGLELRGLPMDEQGLIPAELVRQITRLKAEGKRIAFMYTIPTFHNPTGVTLTEERKRMIARIAQANGIRIVEDDVYRDLAFDGEAMLPTTFYALMQGENVFSIGSFSKTLAPGLRVGWLVGKAGEIENFVNCGTTQMGGGANPFAAQIVAEYCRSGQWTAHVEQLRSLYQRRCETTLAALKHYMPSTVHWTHPTGGFFIWLTLPQGFVAADFKKTALAHGVAVASGAGFFVHPDDGKRCIRLAFSFAALPDIERGVQILGGLLSG
ncbi:MAG: PLP-dependent aminotransferase family protein [Anaerolineae bacterium]|nr:PLP-dependent aminotransferase family protein [Anaerolineae bacterium]